MECDAFIIQSLELCFPCFGNAIPVISICEIPYGNGEFEERGVTEMEAVKCLLLLTVPEWNIRYSLSLRKLQGIKKQVVEKV